MLRELIVSEIMTELLLMVEFAKNNRNSELFFSYSGHGTHYFSMDEKDHFIKHEYIVLVLVLDN